MPGEKSTGSRQPMQPLSSSCKDMSDLLAFLLIQVTNRGALKKGSAVSGKDGGVLCWRCASNTAKQKQQSSQVAVPLGGKTVQRACIFNELLF
mmetsp:Transcript_33354/g.53106  ORF Transcript_33354/g.53106 Transcript_33354/m.53106 type:complete len:93 (-) Transcript_33354:109-387(-)